MESKYVNRRKYPKINGVKDEWGALENHQREILNDISQLEFLAKRKKQAEYSQDLISQARYKYDQKQLSNKSRSLEKQNIQKEELLNKNLIQGNTEFRNQLKSIVSKDLDEQKRNRLYSVNQNKLESLKDYKSLEILDQRAQDLYNESHNQKKSLEKSYNQINYQMAQQKAKRRLEEKKMECSLSNQLSLDSNRKGIQREITYKNVRFPFYSVLPKH